MSGGGQVGLKSVYMRGGTSRALFFHMSDLPGSVEDRAPWAPIFAAALGSPDPGGRQLDGLGGGISSLSKIAVIGPSTHADADVDYIFGQVAVKGMNVSYRGNCGNISAAVGPYAIDEALVEVNDGEARVRIHHVASGKIIHAHVRVEEGRAAVSGDFAIQGVAGTGSPIRLDFLDPGGSATGLLLPTGQPRQTMMVDGRELEVSLVDAANPVVFVAAAAVGLRGDERPSDIDADPILLALLEELRVAASLEMGVAQTQEEARTLVPNLPLVAIVSAPPQDADIQVRMISAGQPHKATPLTGAMCLAVAARLSGSVVADLIGTIGPGTLRIAHASGILPVDAIVEDGSARSVTVFRTARRLMEGSVLIPAPAMGRQPT
jgi:2-methylaconitate cis-trans-isomerase PrpF